MAEGRRTALVTGGGMGIGEGIARELGRNGYAVAIHYAGSQLGAEATVEAIQAGGGEAVAIAGDLRDVAVCQQVVDAAREAFGGLDLLVNNAGVTDARDFLDTDQTAYDRMFDLNMRAYFFCAQRAVPSMRARGGGCIINISSVHGGAGYPQHAAYAATKGAIVAFTRSLSASLVEQGIRVNAVAPGPIWTPLIVSTFPEEKVETFGKDVPMQRAGQPSEVAPAFVFLACDDSSYITGQVIHPNGGTVVNG